TNVIKVDLDMNYLYDIISVESEQIKVEKKQPTYLNNSMFINKEFLFNVVFAAADAFRKQNLQQYAISLNNFVIPYCSSIGDFKTLSRCYVSVMQLYQDIKNVNKYVGFFYRVTFYGNAFEALFITFEDEKNNTSSRTNNNMNPQNNNKMGVFKREYIYRITRHLSTLTIIN
ncbi:hypothetical protein EIN_421950, partial [Entamoeba invadens IP1]